MDAADYGPSPVDAVTTFLISAVVSVLFVVAALALACSHATINYTLSTLLELFCGPYFPAAAFLPALSSNLILHPAVPYLTENGTLLDEKGK